MFRTTQDNVRLILETRPENRSVTDVDVLVQDMQRWSIIAAMVCVLVAVHGQFRNLTLQSEIVCRRLCALMTYVSFSQPNMRLCVTVFNCCFLIVLG